MRRAIAGLVAMIALGAASPAAAQEDEPLLDAEARRLLSTLLVLTSASTTVYILQGVTDRLLDKIFADARLYMRNNRAALQHAVSLGGGDPLADMARIYEVPARERPAFYQRARGARSSSRS